MIAINLYDYRQELKRVVVQKHVTAAAGVVLAALLMAAISWSVEQAKLGGLQAEIAEVEDQIKALDGKVKAVRKMQSQMSRLSQIIDGVQTLRTQQVPTAQTLFDIYKAVPDGLWFESIKAQEWLDLQRKNVPTIFVTDPVKGDKKKDDKKKEERKEEFIEIKGWFFSEDSVARFIESLERVPYFKRVFLFKMEKPEKATIPVRHFTLYCYTGEIKSA
ncbi:MAG: PilN domain-containing protein [Nitrospinae bacterium]|nr:PilN domain-containing protein [Nitrospinota bacterium]